MSSFDMAVAHKNIYISTQAIVTMICKNLHREIISIAVSISIQFVNGSYSWLDLIILDNSIAVWCLLQHRSLLLRFTLLVVIGIMCVGAWVYGVVFGDVSTIWSPDRYVQHFQNRRHSRSSTLRGITRGDCSPTLGLILRAKVNECIEQTLQWMQACHEYNVLGSWGCNKREERWQYHCHVCDNEPDALRSHKCGLGSRDVADRTASARQKQRVMGIWAKVLSRGKKN